MRRDPQTAGLIYKLKNEISGLKKKVTTRDKRINGLVRGFGLMKDVELEETRTKLAEAEATISRLVRKQVKGKR